MGQPIDGQPLLADRAVGALSVATVGPCPTCRRIISGAYQDSPELPFWFHLAPQPRPCARHRRWVEPPQ